MKTNPLDRSLSRRGFLARTASAAALLALGRLGAFAQGAGAKLPSAMELALNVEIAPPDTSRYHRPYVAAWIENANGQAVRTLSLWVENSGRGPRWIPELRRWFNDEPQAEQLVSTLSEPTREPGRYTLVWDGKGDNKAAVGQGDYFVCVEAAREHGPYSLVREKITLGTAAFTKTLGGDGDIGSVGLAYRKRA